MKKVMKRIMHLMLICVIFNTLCVARVEALSPPDGLKHHSEERFNDLQKWINNPDEDKEGFEALIQNWKGFKGFSVPMYGGVEADKVYVDSNVENISFHFSNPGVNIYADKVYQRDSGISDDIYSYYENVKFDVRISSKSDQMWPGYQPYEYMYSKVRVDMMDKQRDCVLYTEYGKDNNYYVLDVIENGIVFQFSYYSKKDFNENMFKGFLFKQTKKDLVQPVTCKFAKKKFVIKRGQKKTLRTKISGPEKYSFTLNRKKVVKIINASSKFVKIKAVKKGTVTITAKAGNKKSKCKVVVK